MVNTRELLRDATDQVHQRLHVHPCFRALLSGSITKRDYGVLLVRLRGYHLSLEAALHGPDLTTNGRPSRALGDDLLAFGMHPDRCERAVEPSLPSPAARLGCLYVRDGAKMGGRMLAQKLDHLCGSSDKGRTFFAGSPTDAAQWRSLCEDLEQLHNQACQAEALAAAVATFELFERWMDLMEPIADFGVYTPCP
jgi:heme oxygenase (biliverdin-IX-beta and delta-forming)